MKPGKECGHLILWLIAFSTPLSVLAQQDPRIGYVYPAGGQQGTEVEITVGGQFLDDASALQISGAGIEAVVIDHQKPLSRKQYRELREKLRQLLQQRSSARTGARSTPSTNAIDQEIAQLRKKLVDPKKQPNPQIGETVTFRLKVASEAETGKRELRVRTPRGLSNPLPLWVSDLPEFREEEPNDSRDGKQVQLPALLNGQILPGDVDYCHFEARKGDQLVTVVSARELIPYMADAVPGWFQATLTLFDAEGEELAFSDDYRFHPDPVLLFQIPADGKYVLEIRDSIYRGREDFVYRIAAGKLPFVTSVFPLGGPVDAVTEVELRGWNLKADRLTVSTGGEAPGLQMLPLDVRGRFPARYRFAVDDLSECLEQEPNNEKERAQRVNPAVMINGRISGPGDRDVFQFDGRAGEEIVAEVYARRLNSPLDSILRLRDSSGQELIANDDREDRAAGLTTHHSDSQLIARLPADGSYYLYLGDVQQKGGQEYGYRLRLSGPRPDFEIRVVPSSLNARGGATVPVTAYAVRRDGFNGDIDLQLMGAPRGLRLSGGWIPAGQNQIQMTLTMPFRPLSEPVSLRLEGRAQVQGRLVRRFARPAEDMTQAFVYHHLVPAEEWLVSVSGRARHAPIRIASKQPVAIPGGEEARVRFVLPKRLPPEPLQFELKEPKEGITIQEVSRLEEGVQLVFQCSAAKVEPGMKGNLIVEAFIERAIRAKDGSKPASKRRLNLGTLPAVQYEIVEPLKSIPGSDANTGRGPAQGVGP